MTYAWNVFWKRKKAQDREVWKSEVIGSKISKIIQKLVGFLEV